MNITVIAYKSSGSTSCRGCVMDQWESDQEIMTFGDRNNAITWAADFYYRNHVNDLGHYELSYIVNGGPSESYYYDGEWLDEYDEWLEEGKNIAKEAARIGAEKYQAYKDQKALEKLKKETAEKELKVKKDLELLAKLKEQYGE
jgi:hypothetical protein